MDVLRKKRRSRAMGGWRVTYRRCRGNRNNLEARAVVVAECDDG